MTRLRLKRRMNARQSSSRRKEAFPENLSSDVFDRFIDHGWLWDFFLCVCLCVCALSAMVKNRMMPSSRELAANIWLTNDDVDTRAHKPINQTPPPQLTN